MGVGEGCSTLPFGFVVRRDSARIGVHQTSTTEPDPDGPLDAHSGFLFLKPAGTSRGSGTTLPAHELENYLLS
jgi:hypothetical protein